jgi:hypothetical protein
MSKKKNKKKKKSTKTQFDILYTASTRGKLADLLLNFYSPVDGEIIATAGRHEEIRGLVIDFNDDYCYSVGRLKQIVEWAEGLEKPAAIELLSEEIK